MTDKRITYLQLSKFVALMPRWDNVAEVNKQVNSFYDSLPEAAATPRPAQPTMAICEHGDEDNDMCDSCRAEEWEGKEPPEQPYCLNCMKEHPVGECWDDEEEPPAQPCQLPCDIRAKDGVVITELHLAVKRLEQQLAAKDAELDRLKHRKTTAFKIEVDAYRRQADEWKALYVAKEEELAALKGELARQDCSKTTERNEKGEE